MRGSVKIMETDYNFLAYERFTGEEQMLMVFNNSYEQMERVLHVRNIGVDDSDMLIRLIETDHNGFDTDLICYDVRGGEVRVTLPPTSAMVLHVQK